MWETLLIRFLQDLIRDGALWMIFPDGRRIHFGDALAEPVAIHVRDPSVIRKLLFSPELSLGEAYMEGTLTVENDDLYRLMELIFINYEARSKVWHLGLISFCRRMVRALAQFNPAKRSKENVAHHYDLSGELYDLFLDADRQYSCAYFREGQNTLEQGQEDKKALIAHKLLLKPGQSVLDIGCGWGGLGLHLARHHQARVSGVTLSEEQYRIARARARGAALKEEPDFLLQDYRYVTKTFDRVVSVGMFEHVGVPHYREFFDNVRARLNDDGVALIHTIGRTGPPGATNPWITKYIFPGGYCPALSEIMKAVEKAGLVLTDVEVLRLHYADTLRAWRERFEANIDRVRDIYDERFCRMWRFYLIASEMSFREADHVVFQLQLAKHREAVPLTRDYLFEPKMAKPKSAPRPSARKKVAKAGRKPTGDRMQQNG